MQSALRVFVSGTQDDLQPERDAVERAISGRGWCATRAETLGSQSHNSRQTILEAVRDCDIYLGLYGRRYGWIVPGEGVSATELEYDESQRIGKPTIVYIKDCANTEPEQRAFVNRVQDFDAGYFRRPRFESVASLAEWVVEDLDHLIAELVRDPDNLRVRQLRRAYANEVKQRFRYWMSRYIPLSASSSPQALEHAGMRTSGQVPSQFLPRGFRRQTFGRPDHGSASAKVFDDVLDAAKGGRRSRCARRTGLGKNYFSVAANVGLRRERAREPWG